MQTRTADATWEGALADGSGPVALGSDAYGGPYSFAPRFEDDDGTDPEELIGAAEAGCYAMALADALTGRGTSPSGSTPRRPSTSTPTPCRSRPSTSRAVRSMTPVGDGRAGWPTGREGPLGS